MRFGNHPAQKQFAQALAEMNLTDALKATQFIDWREEQGKPHGGFGDLFQFIIHDLTEKTQKHADQANWAEKIRENNHFIKEIFSSLMDQGYNLLRDPYFSNFVMADISGRCDPCRTLGFKDMPHQGQSDLLISPWFVDQCYQRNLRDPDGNDFLGMILMEKLSTLDQDSLRQFLSWGCNPDTLVSCGKYEASKNAVVTVTTSAVAALFFEEDRHARYKSTNDLSNLDRFKLKENIKTARILMEHGANLTTTLPDGTTTAQSLREFFTDPHDRYFNEPIAQDFVREIDAIAAREALHRELSQTVLSHGSPRLPKKM